MFDIPPKSHVPPPDKFRCATLLVPGPKPNSTLIAHADRVDEELSPCTGQMEPERSCDSVGERTTPAQSSQARLGAVA
jgi:hypothetical protein